jgi:hypothetical protein
MKKSYKTSKHTNKLYILHQNTKKINILKNELKQKLTFFFVICIFNLKDLRFFFLKICDLFINI